MQNHSSENNLKVMFVDKLHWVTSTIIMNLIRKRGRQVHKGPAIVGFGKSLMYMALPAERLFHVLNLSSSSHNGETYNCTKSHPLIMNQSKK